MSVSSHQIQASLKDYLRIIFQRRWFFFVPFLLVFTTAVIGSFFLPRYYESSVLVLVEEENIVNPLVPREERLVSQVQGATLAEKLKTLTEQILSYPQLIKLVRLLELDKDIKDPFSYEKLIRGIRKRTSVRMKAVDVFEISYEDRDPVMARQLVNTLSALFIQENLERKTESALMGVKFAEEQAEVYKERLEMAEKALYNFREQYALELPGKSNDMNAQFLINYQTSLTQVELGLKEAEEVLNKTSRQLSGQEAVIISEDLINLNPLVGRLTAELSQLETRLEAKKTENLDDEEIPELMSKIEEVREKLGLETKKIVDAETALTAPLFYERLEQLQKDALQTVRDLEARRQHFELLVNEYEDKIESLPEQERAFTELTRDVRVNQNIYEMLRMKVEEERLTSVELKEKGTRYEILEEGRLPLKHSKPQRFLTSMIAFIIGILSGFGCVFLVEFADHSFRGLEDAKQYFDLPILGSITSIISAAEIRRKRLLNIKITWFLIVCLIVLIIYAVFYSYMQAQGITDKILRQQIYREKTSIHGLMKKNLAAQSKNIEYDKSYDNHDEQAKDNIMSFLRDKNIYSKLVIKNLRGKNDKKVIIK